MKKRILILVTFSSLRTSGGGIEGWIQKMIKKSYLLKDLYEKIYIVGFSEVIGEGIFDFWNNDFIVPKLLTFKHNFSSGKILFFIYNLPIASLIRTDTL